MLFVCVFAEFAAKIEKNFDICKFFFTFAQFFYKFVPKKIISVYEKLRV